MASSVEEVSYEFGSLFAVALLGSLMAALYSANVQLPPGAADAARDGIVEALSLAGAAGASGDVLFAAVQAFDRSYLTVMYVIAGVLLLGAALTSILLRRHGPGSVAYTVASH